LIPDYICKISGKISRLNPNKLNMKNKILHFALLTLTVLTLASCAGSRGGYGRKGYGCPSTATVQNPSVDNKI